MWRLCTSFLLVLAPSVTMTRTWWGWSLLSARCLADCCQWLVQFPQSSRLWPALQPVSETDSRQRTVWQRMRNCIIKDTFVFLHTIFANLYPHPPPHPFPESSSEPVSVPSLSFVGSSSWKKTRKLWTWLKIMSHDSPGGELMCSPWQLGWRKRGKRDKSNQWMMSNYPRSAGVEKN